MVMSFAVVVTDPVFADPENFWIFSASQRGRAPDGVARMT